MKLCPPFQPRKTPRGRRTDPDDPLHFSIPTLKELECQIRRRSIGRTITEICMDLGVIAGGCDGECWNEIYLTLTNFGGKFEDFFRV